MQKPSTRTAPKKTTTARSEGNLPSTLTHLIGRKGETAKAKKLLSSSRLVTLTGTGGVGKSRLAMSVAENARRAFPGGTWLLDLSSLQNKKLLAEALATTLGLNDRLAGTTHGLLVDFLSTRRSMVVFDNCEHMVEEVAPFLEYLLKKCSELHVLATAREPLGIGGEALLRVLPMKVPISVSSNSRTASDLTRYDAIALFSERATLAVPDFELSENNWEPVVEICRCLDGLPLALELAAARLRVMSLEQIIDRLNDRFRLLTAGNRLAPPRQQTLRLCMDWSYELCSNHDRELWARLAVFSGGFELDAAEYVCSNVQMVDNVLDGIASLVDKSILIREDRGSVVRYRLLETIREYGLEKLQTSEGHLALQRRHSQWYLQLALRAQSEWIGPNQAEWLMLVAREQPNFQNAIEHCLADPTITEDALRITSALHDIWVTQGILSEGRYWLNRALSAASDLRTHSTAHALDAASALAELHGDLVAAKSLTDRLHQLAEMLGDSNIKTRSCAAAARFSFFKGDLELACAQFESILPIDREGQDPYRLLEDLLGLGLAADHLGNSEYAISCHNEIISITKPVGECVHRAYSLWALGVIAWKKAEQKQAKDLVIAGLRLTQKVRNPLNTATCLQVLAWISASQSDALRAATLLGAADSVRSSIGSPPTLIPNFRGYQATCRRRALAQLGARKFDTAFRRGKTMTVTDAVSFALGETVEVHHAENSGIRLTQREQEVVRLVAKGLTNREVAEELVVAQRTVAGHVEHILSKLGFTSRAQIAAWHVEHKPN